MEQCYLIRAERVLCDEVLIVKDVEPEVPVQLPLPPGSHLVPERTRVEVTVLGCDLLTDLAGNRFTVDLTLLFCKEIAIHRPGAPELPLAFSFSRTFRGLPIARCRPRCLPPQIIKRLHCQVFDIRADDRISLDPAMGTFSEALTVTLTVKVVFEDQIPFRPCSEVPCLLFAGGLVCGICLSRQGAAKRKGRIRTAPCRCRRRRVC